MLLASSLRLPQHLAPWVLSKSLKRGVYCRCHTMSTVRTSYSRHPTVLFTSPCSRVLLLSIARSSQMAGDMTLEERKQDPNPNVDSGENWKSRLARDRSSGVNSRCGIEIRLDMRMYRDINT